MAMPMPMPMTMPPQVQLKRGRGLFCVSLQLRNLRVLHCRLLSLSCWWHSDPNLWYIKHVKFMIELCMTQFSTWLHIHESGFNAISFI